MGPLTAAVLREPAHQRFPVTDTAAPGAVRRAAMGYARAAGLTETVVALAGQLATELATNLLRHAVPGGWMLVRPLRPPGVELLAVDRGPGIRDLDRALAGDTPNPYGLGCGLASVRLGATRFDVHTQPGRGTVVLAVVQPGGPKSPTWAGVSVGLEEVCGDGWTVSDVDGGLTVAVVDGLGHGVPASLATDAALHSLARYPVDLAAYRSHGNEAMRGTRGAALAACRLYPDRGQLSCLSIGNIGGRVHAAGRDHSLVPFNGTLGLSATPPRAQILDYPWPPGATLVLWSDGLDSRVCLADREDLVRHDPAVIAAVLHRDHGKERDDATVVVVQNELR